MVVALQLFSYLTVAFSWNEPVAIFGVVLASMSSGFGEITYLALASHFSSFDLLPSPSQELRISIVGWSSGTGAAGILASSAYLVLTEPHIARLAPSHALLCMISLTVLFALMSLFLFFSLTTRSYWTLLKVPPSVRRACLRRPSTWIMRVPETTHRPRSGFFKTFRVKLHAITVSLPGIRRLLH